MIINTGQRTDIPAFYAQWFANRLKEGFVCVRNPYNPNQVSRYRLDPSVVDVIGFCTKNPAPMFPHMDLLKDYGQYWFVTITPYGRDIEPNVPDKHRLLDDFKRLSDMVGVHAIGWRYDPIFVSQRYTMDYHVRAFGQIASALDGYTETAVISFIDLYPKVRRNFPEAREVGKEQRLALGKELIRLASGHSMTVRPCAEGDALAAFGADCGGCMRISDYERAIGQRLNAPKRKGARGVRLLPGLRHRRLQHLQASVQILLRKRGTRKGSGAKPPARSRVTVPDRQLYGRRQNPRCASKVMDRRSDEPELRFVSLPFRYLPARLETVHSSQEIRVARREFPRFPPLAHSCPS